MRWCSESFCWPWLPAFGGVEVEYVCPKPYTHVSHIHCPSMFFSGCPQRGQVRCRWSTPIHRITIHSTARPIPIHTSDERSSVIIRAVLGYASSPPTSAFLAVRQQYDEADPSRRTNVWLGEIGLVSTPPVASKSLIRTVGTRFKLVLHGPTTPHRTLDSGAPNPARRPDPAYEG